MDVHNSGYPRKEHDFYVEPASCFDVLINIMGRSDFEGGIYDPAVGVGTIAAAAQRFGLRCMGSDIVDRRPKVGAFKFAVRDFLHEPTHTDVWPAVVMNPPYKTARQFIEKALRETRRSGVVAALAPVSFLASQERHAFFNGREIERVIVLSKRPSMPDGDALPRGDVTRGGGKTNYLLARVSRGRTKRRSGDTLVVATDERLPQR
jgi:hypothetical protein